MSEDEINQKSAQIIQLIKEAVELAVEIDLSPDLVVGAVKSNFMFHVMRETMGGMSADELHNLVSDDAHRPRLRLVPK